jgi:hypothetical protein
VPDREPPSKPEKDWTPDVRDWWSAVFFLAVAAVGVLMALHNYQTAGGDWMRRIGGGGRSHPVQMWVLFGMAAAIAAFGLVGLGLCARLLVKWRRQVRSKHPLHEDDRVNRSQT